MDPKLSWEPVFVGKTLSPCRLTETLVQANACPVHTDSVQRPWSEEVLGPEFARFTILKDSLRECVLALWRLKAVEEKGSDDNDWQEHVGAWLFRYADIVEFSKVGTLPVLDQYIEALRATKNLRADIFETLKHPLAMLSEAAKTTVVSKDVEMTEADPPEAEVITIDSETPRRPRKRNKVIASSPVPEENVVQAGPNETGTKRGLQVSPSQNDGPSKRTRTTTKAAVLTAEPVDQGGLGLDLGGLIVKEDDLVDLTMVPLAKEQVCGKCAKSTKSKASSICTLVWALHRQATIIKCMNCVNAKKPCFGATADWGISVMPNVTPSEAGVERRSKDSAPKRSATKGKGKVTAISMAREVSEGSAISEMESISMAKQESEEPIPTAKVKKTPEDSLPAVPSSNSGPSQLQAQGRVEQVYFQDLIALEAAALHDSSRTVTSISSAHSEVKAAWIREAAHAELISKLVKERQNIMRRLTKRMEVEVEILLVKEHQEFSIRQQLLDDAAGKGKGQEDGEDEEEGTGVDN